VPPATPNPQNTSRQGNIYFTVTKCTTNNPQTRENTTIRRNDDNAPKSARKPANTTTNTLTIT